MKDEYRPITLNPDDVIEAIYENSVATERYFIGPKGVIDEARLYMHAGWNDRFDDLGIQPFVPAREIRDELEITDEGSVEASGPIVIVPVLWTDGHPDNDEHEVETVFISDND